MSVYVGANSLAPITVGTSNFYSLMYGNGLFVSPHTGSTSLYSEDGVHWQSVSNNITTSYFYSYAYGNGIFIAIDNRGNVIRSTDGKQWTSVGNIGISNASRIVFDGTKFLAIQVSSKTLAISEDGLTWTVNTSALPVSADWVQSLAYGNGVYVAAGSYSNVIIRSTDGVNWTEVTYPITNNPRYLIYGKDKFILIPNKGNEGAYSTDGLTWTKITLPSTSYWSGGIIYAFNKFMLSRGSSVYSSSDGISWPTNCVYVSYNYTAQSEDKLVGITSSGYVSYTTDGNTFTSNSYQDVAHKVSRISVGAGDPLTITKYEDSIYLNSSTIGDHFTITNDTYYFTLSGDTFTATSGVFNSLQYPSHGGRISTTLTSKKTQCIYIDYTISNYYWGCPLTIYPGRYPEIYRNSDGSGTIMLYVTEGMPIRLLSIVVSNPDPETVVTIKLRVGSGNISTVEELVEARQVVSGYVGINSVARPFFSTNNGLVYWGNLGTPLSVARYGSIPGTFNNYAFFAGGTISYDNASYTNVVDVYNSDLTRISPATLNINVTGGGCPFTSHNVCIGSNYILFAGGWYYSGGVSSYVNAYNSNLVRSNPSSLLVAADDPTGALAGSYILFAGGDRNTSSSRHSTTVTAYSSNLTRSSPTALSKACAGMAGTHVGSYGLFAGGLSYETNTAYSSIDVYNASLTRTLLDLTSTSDDLVAGCIGSYALIMGGSNSYVHSVDESLTVTKLNSYLYDSNVSNVIESENLLICHHYGRYVYSFDKNLTCFTDVSASITDKLDRDMSAARTGNYVIFAGGDDTGAGGKLDNGIVCLITK